MLLEIDKKKSTKAIVELHITEMVMSIYLWSMNNTKDALDELNTNLPLHLVRNELFEIIGRYFDINELKSSKYIVLSHFWKTAQFGSVFKNGSCDRGKLKTALDYLLYNTFLKFGPSEW